MNDKFPNLPSTSKSSAVALRDKQKSHRQKGEIRSWNRIKKDLNAMNYEQSLAFLERNYTSLLSKLQLTTCKYNILKAKLFSLQSEIENTETQLNKSRTVIRQIKVSLISYTKLQLTF